VTDADADADASTDGPAPSTGTSVPDADAASNDAAPGEVGDVDFADLSLLQRLFVAAAQNPTRGVVIAALAAFAFSFYVALWLAFPQVALLFTVLSVVIVVVLVGVYVGFGRLSR
jgi:hypothetical protein